MRVNFNYEASSTHTAYLVNQREMGKSLLRLSTGMRILEASDDAAGLFIADQLSIVATGLQEGNRNISTGISALRIAENAAGQIFDRLRGIYSRAIRAANDINDPNARAALQREVANLTDAIQKIGTDTEYNGIKLLDGTFQNKYIHYFYKR
jgi:flagellin